MAFPAMRFINPNTPGGVYGGGGGGTSSIGKGFPDTHLENTKYIFPSSDSSLLAFLKLKNLIVKGHV